MIVLVLLSGETSVERGSDKDREIAYIESMSSQQAKEVCYYLTRWL
ncbi:hypothetical protein GCM10009022_22890 [Vreelandella titanicae]|jgi:hypothetical protein|tara:strand:- start:3 stop:140 length:138 start_codon:yes stop_codon:yes gene_type:complete